MSAFSQTSSGWFQHKSLIIGPGASQKRRHCRSAKLMQTTNQRSPLHPRLRFGYLWVVLLVVSYSASVETYDETCHGATAKKTIPYQNSPEIGFWPFQPVDLSPLESTRWCCLITTFDSRSINSELKNRRRSKTWRQKKSVIIHLFLFLLLVVLLMMMMISISIIKLFFSLLTYVHTKINILHVNICISINRYTYTHTHTYIYTYIYIHTHI